MWENEKPSTEIQGFNPEFLLEDLSPQEYLQAITSNIWDIQDKIARLQASLDAIKENPIYSEISTELKERLAILSGQSVYKMREWIDSLLSNLSKIW